MYKAEFSIKLLTIGGVYKPIYRTFIKKAVYVVFSIFVITLFYSLNIATFFYLILHSLYDIDEFAESLSWFLSLSVGCAKLTNFLLQQNNIVKLLNTLDEECLQVRDSREEIMQGKCDHIARRNTKYFFLFGFLTVTAIIFGGLVKARDDINLPIRGSFPYDLERSLAFRLTYFFQAISIYIGAFVTIGSETFVMTMMIQICSQLDIIFHRLECLPLLSENDEAPSVVSAKEATIIRNCVEHHNCIFKFSRKLNRIFSIVFSIQFFGAILSICTFVFCLSTEKEINDRTVIHCMTLSSILFQIFLICHFGNKVMVKSLKVGTITSMIDWTVLTKNTKRQLLLITLRANHPIIMICGSVVPITYKTFLSILRTSYAAYNLMKTMNS